MSAQFVDVRLPSKAYQVSVGAGGLGKVPEQARKIAGEKASRVFVIADTGVPERFADTMMQGLEAYGFRTSIARLTPTEQIKSIETYHRLLVEVAQAGLTRADLVIALGGGVVGDLAGFVAASYQRGVKVIQCPTTLLAMVDASVGGKTGMNLAIPGDEGQDKLFKNLVGAFHQPSFVVADMEVLDSLDLRYRRAGLAECVKHGMISAGIGDGHEGLMDWMIGRLDQMSSFETSTIEELVARNVRLKATVVVRDEHESIEAKAGGRMLLNFGHTFGHAIETIGTLSPEVGAPSLAPLHHGEAVGLGMLAACSCSTAMGRCDASVREELESMLGEVGLPIRVAGLPSSETIIERMGHDKKAAGGSLRVILPTSRGKCEIVDGPCIEALIAGIDSIRY